MTNCEHCPWYDPGYGCGSPRWWGCIRQRQTDEEEEVAKE